jgi:hypothetical protein
MATAYLGGMGTKIAVKVATSKVGTGAATKIAGRATMAAWPTSKAGTRSAGKVATSKAGTRSAGKVATSKAGTRSAGKVATSKEATRSASKGAPSKEAKTASKGATSKAGTMAAGAMVGRVVGTVAATTGGFLGSLLFPSWLTSRRWEQHRPLLRPVRRRLLSLRPRFSFFSFLLISFGEEEMGTAERLIFLCNGATTSYHIVSEYKYGVIKVYIIAFHDADLPFAFVHVFIIALLLVMFGIGTSRCQLMFNKTTICAVHILS